MKKCKRCGEVKPPDQFGNHTRTKDRKRPSCRSCRAIEMAEYRKRVGHPKEQFQYLNKYWPGSTTQEATSKYQAILESQGGVCAICERTPEQNGKKLSVDHCHITGKVRGLLCSGCNTALGALRDNPYSAVRAKEYLEGFHENPLKS